jgi:hypothetical protein
VRGISIHLLLLLEIPTRATIVPKRRPTIAAPTEMIRVSFKPSKIEVRYFPLAKHWITSLKNFIMLSFYSVMISKSGQRPLEVARLPQSSLCPNSINGEIRFKQIPVVKK